MRVTLKSDKHGKEHSFNIVVMKTGVLLTTPDGKAIADLTVETGETDIQDGDGKYTMVPTNNFFLSFRDLTASGQRTAAFVETE
jgi:hypothetical protein